MTMRIDIATLFPEMCEAVLGESIIGRARRAGKLEIHCHNIRDYTQDKHRRVDDTPYGGGKGMLMQTEPIYNCYQAVCEMIAAKPHVIYMSPKGQPFSQQRAIELREYENIFILCGHYEGVDQRVLDEIVDEEISLGDYVLTGGELGALVVADAVGRLCPGVLSESVLPRRAITAVCWNIRSTPARRCGMGWRCRRCCRADTMPTSSNGSGSSRFWKQQKNVPTCCGVPSKKESWIKRSLPLPDSCWKKRMNSSRLFVSSINCHRRRSLGPLVQW